MWAIPGGGGCRTSSEPPSPWIHPWISIYNKSYYLCFQQICSVVQNLKTNATQEACVTWFGFWRYLTRGLIWHLCQSSIRPSIYFSSIVKSRSNPFLEPSSTKQQGKSFLLKETTGAFAWGSNPRPPHYESVVQPTAPRRPFTTTLNHVVKLYRTCKVNTRFAQTWMTYMDSVNHSQFRCNRQNSVPFFI